MLTARCLIRDCAFRFDVGDSGATASVRCDGALVEHVVRAHTPREVAEALISQWQGRDVDRRAFREDLGEPPPAVDRVPLARMAPPGTPAAVRLPPAKLEPQRPAARRARSAPGPRADSIPSHVVAVLVAAGAPMRAADVLLAVSRRTPRARSGNVSVALANLAQRGRIRRVGPGRYAALTGRPGAA